LFLEVDVSEVAGKDRQNVVSKWKGASLLAEQTFSQPLKRPHNYPDPSQLTFKVLLQAVGRIKYTNRHKSTEDMADAPPAPTQSSKPKLERL